MIKHKPHKKTNLSSIVSKVIKRQKKAISAINYVQYHLTPDTQRNLVASNIKQFVCEIVDMVIDRMSATETLASGF